MEAALEDCGLKVQLAAMEVLAVTIFGVGLGATALMSSEFGKGLGNGLFVVKKPTGYHRDQCRDDEAPVEDLRVPHWFEQRPLPRSMSQKGPLEQSIRPIREPTRESRNKQPIILARQEEDDESVAQASGVDGDEDESAAAAGARHGLKPTGNVCQV